MFTALEYDRNRFDHENEEQRKEEQREQRRKDLDIKHKYVLPLAIRNTHHRMHIHEGLHHKSWSCVIPSHAEHYDLADVLGTVWTRGGHDWRDLRDGDSFTLEIKGIGSSTSNHPFFKVFLVTIVGNELIGVDKQFWDISNSNDSHRVSGRYQVPVRIIATIHANQ